MIKSMTGFGRSEVTDGQRRFTVEMKSVNHRYLDVSMKMPKKLNFFDATIRNLLKEYIQRGKVDVYITYEDLSEQTVSVKYHPDVAATYLQYFKEMEDAFSLKNDVSVSVLGRCPEVFSMEDVEIDEEEIWKDLESAVRKACEGFVESRIKEGANLQKDLVEKLDGMLAIVDFIEENSPKIVEEYRKKLEARVQEILGSATVDENRLLTEVTIYADKICVDEEIVRLRSHIEMVKNTILAGGSIGRKLDFIVQEMNREANTILSKTTDLELSNRGIELKTEIEKIREQIQNIE
ncbi:MAG: YicC family protein [Lachnospiraceae bacterium]|nr:YicC family protein [Lachnospiraceae bacterium]